MTIPTHPASRRARLPATRRARLPFWRSALGVGLLLVLAAACGDSEPEPAAAPPAGTPAARTATPPAAPQAAANLDPGPAETGEGSVPKGFPEDLPLYPDARPIRWMAGVGAGSLVAFEADSDPAAVYEYYAEKLPGQGWVLETQTETPSHWLLVASKGERKARISIASAPSGGAQFGVAVGGAGD